MIAVEPSAGMRRALRTGLDEHGLENVRVVPGTWPEPLDELGPLPAADVALIAHVGYDIERDRPVPRRDGGGGRRALRGGADRPQPGARWPTRSGRSSTARSASRCRPCRTSCALLQARGRRDRGGPRRALDAAAFDSVEALTAFLRRQLFIAEGGEKDVHFRAVLPDMIVRRDGAWTLAEGPAGSVGVVTWPV